MLRLALRIKLRLSDKEGRFQIKERGDFESPEDISEFFLGDCGVDAGAWWICIDLGEGGGVDVVVSVVGGAIPDNCKDIPGIIPVVIPIFGIIMHIPGTMEFENPWIPMCCVFVCSVGEDVVENDWDP